MIGLAAILKVRRDTRHLDLFNSLYRTSSYIVDNNLDGDLFFHGYSGYDGFMESKQSDGRYYSNWAPFYSNPVYSIASDGAGTYVGISRGGGAGMNTTGSIAYSSDLDNWETDNRAIFLMNPRVVIYAAGSFYIFGDNRSSGLCEVASSADGTSWNIMSTTATGGSKESATYGAGVFVAPVGGVNKILRSTDGLTWTAIAFGHSGGVQKVAYGAGVFVAYTTQPTLINIYTSPDGITWTLRDFVAAPASISNIVYINSLFVASSSNTVLTSADGITWTSETPPAGSASTITAYGAGVYAAGYVDNTNATARSADLITWSYPTASYNLNQVHSLSFLNGLFIAGGRDGYISSSPDATTWTKRGLVGSFRSDGVGIPVESTATNGAGIYIAGGGHDYELRSTDKVTWTRHATTGSTDTTFVAYLNTLFFAVDYSGSTYTSNDGATWTHRVNLYGNGKSIAYGAGLYVGCNDNGEVKTSPDGIAWTTRNTATVSPLRHIAYGNGLFMAGAHNGEIVTSTDGITWNLMIAPFTNRIMGLAFGASKFLASDSNNNLYSSPSGMAWTPVTNPFIGYIDGSTYIERVAFGGGVFVISDNGNGYATSADGITFVIGSSFATNRYPVDVVYDEIGTYVAVGYDGMVVTSVNGTDWTRQLSITSNNLSHVSFGNNLFVATNDVSSVWRSSDGITWTDHATPFVALNIHFFNSLFIINAATSEVSTSPDGVTWTSRGTPGGGFVSDMDDNGTNLVIGVTTSGNAITSTDGLTWVLRATPASMFNSIAYGNGIFTACGDDGAIYTTTDGITWTVRTVPGYLDLEGIHYTNGIFAAAGVGNFCVYSMDYGVTWLNADPVSLLGDTIYNVYSVGNKFLFFTEYSVILER